MRGAPILLALPMLAACSDASDKADTQLDTKSAHQAQIAGKDAVEPAPAAAPSPVVTPAGERAAPELEALGARLDVDLGETLGGCAFAKGGKTLLVAGAPDDAAATGRGAVRIAGLTRLLTGKRAGGPDYINKGPAMSDGEVTVQVKRGRGRGHSGGRRKHPMAGRSRDIAGRRRADLRFRKMDLRRMRAAL